MKDQLVDLIRSALAALPPDSLPADAANSIEIERTRDPVHGDFATNIALRIAKAAGRNPRELAQAIANAIPQSELVVRTEVAGAGFINLHLAPGAYSRELGLVHEQRAHYGRSTFGNRRRVLVEFVSANPTGPLHVGHGRHAAYGSTVASLLDAVGFDVAREFYINDAGRQMDILGVSVWLRYLERCGEPVAFPSNGYRGDYLRPIAEAMLAAEFDPRDRTPIAHREHQFHRPAADVFRDLPPDAPEGDKDKHVDALIARARALLGAAGFERVLDFSLQRMLAEIRDDLHEFGVHFESWFSERSLATSGAIERALERLKSQGRIYTKDGALWFRASEFGDDEDRVVVRENGAKTYFASDIAYHLYKRERGFENLIDVLGADHHGYVARVRAGLMAMGEPGDCLEVRLIQLVSLYRGEDKLAMGKREGQFVTLRQLREEVGNDACRLFYLMRSNEQALDFDLELAKSRSMENPVYYVQYAHARVASVMKKLASLGLSFDLPMARANLDKLTDVRESAVLRDVSRYPEAVHQAAINRAPHTLVQYLRELASSLQTYYDGPHKWIVDQAELRNARLMLVLGVQQVIRNGLELLGISAPETM